MDFEMHFSEELEEFRKEVRAFVKRSSLKKPMAPRELRRSPEVYYHGRDVEREMGTRGWFAPNYPKQYGGGGLDIGRCIILAEEFARADNESVWPCRTAVSGIFTGGIMSQGTTEQKDKFLPKILKAEWEIFQCFTEPDAGSDEAAMVSTAIRDGNDYIINGDKIYVGVVPNTVRPNALYWAAVTDPKAPRHQNISAFFIPGDLPGIEYRLMDLIGVATDKWEVICHDVRCPKEYLIGEENKGWLVTQGTLALEHGGGGSLIPGNDLILKIVDYCKNTLRNGKPISNDPKIQDILVNLYMEYQVGRLWGIRNYAQSMGQIPRKAYTGTQTSLHGKRLRPEMGLALLEILGPSALIDEAALRVLTGTVEQEVQDSDCTHAGGTPEVQQIMMSRGIGLGRRK